MSVLKKVSLILCTYNCLDNLRKTLATIECQDYPVIEVVIEDGGSTDGTLQVIKDFEKSFTGLGRTVVWRSERDKGIYDAMNKGYGLSGGDIIVFFNDLFLDKHAVSYMVEAIEEGGSRCLGAHADLIYVADTKLVRYWKMGRGTFLKGWMPGHPTLYLKREVYEKYGLFNTSYKCSADYEFMIRSLAGREDRLQYVPRLLVEMYYGGTSTGGISSYLVSLQEGHRALKENGIKWAFMIDLKRTARIAVQFLRARRERRRKADVL